MGQGVNRGQAGKREQKMGWGGGRSRARGGAEEGRGQGPGKLQGEEGGQAELGEVP